VRRLGLPDRFVEHGERRELLADLGLDEAGILETCLREVERAEGRGEKGDGRGEKGEGRRKKEEGRGETGEGRGEKREQMAEGRR